MYFYVVDIDGYDWSTATGICKRMRKWYQAPAHLMVPDTKEEYQALKDKLRAMASDFIIPSDIFAWIGVYVNQEGKIDEIRFIET